MEERLRLCVGKLRNYGDSNTRRRVCFNLMLGNAFFLAFCVLFNIADVRNLLVRVFLLLPYVPAHHDTSHSPGGQGLACGYVGPCLVACVFLLHYLVTEVSGKLESTDDQGGSPFNCNNSTASPGDSTVHPSIRPNDLLSGSQGVTSLCTELMTSRDLPSQPQLKSFKHGVLQVSHSFDVTDLNSCHTETGDVIPDPTSAQVTREADLIHEDCSLKIESVDSESNNMTVRGSATSTTYEITPKKLHSESKACETESKNCDDTAKNDSAASKNGNAALKSCEAMTKSSDSAEQSIEEVSKSYDASSESFDGASKNSDAVSEIRDIPKCLPQRDEKKIGTAIKAQMSLGNNIEVRQEMCETVMTKFSPTAKHIQDETSLNNLSLTGQNNENDTIDTLPLTPSKNKHGLLIGNLSKTIGLPQGEDENSVPIVLLTTQKTDMSTQTDIDETPPPPPATSDVTTMTDVTAPPAVCTSATMTDQLGTRDVASGAALALYRHSSAMTSGPFMKKLRRARRVLKEAKVKVARDRVSTLTPWKVRLEKYRDKIGHLTEVIANKDQLIGVTSVSRRQQEDEIKVLTSTLRSSQDKLETQQKLNMKLMTGIQDRGGLVH